MTKKSTKVYAGVADDSSNATITSSVVSAAKESNRVRKKVMSRLSHDISTEQLFSDQLIDGKVADGEDDGNDTSSDSDGHAGFDGDSLAPRGRIYRIESHSALSSLDARRLEKTTLGEGSMTSTTTATPAVDARPTARTYKLAPLPGSPTAVALASASPSRAAAVVPLETVESLNDQQPHVCTQCSQSSDMPPMHCAAYAGHMTCLELLLQSDTEAETSDQQEEQTKKKSKWLDKKQRTPLFYACAANRLECCALLARVRHVWLDTADRQLDTPVHVCCFFGWHKCLQLLLDASADPHGRNAKGFKPSHLAATPECLEALLAFGDDLLQGDKLGRSPLFVACARNRPACVEFLCAWNHQSRAWMLEQEDQRGDRAIHAASCNGSAASLAVLLRYGADALAANAKGLKPRDLARANKHHDCEALLAQAEEELAASAGTSWFAPANAADGGENNYNQSDAGEGNSNYWVQCWDNDSGQAFYYHNLTGKCQWEAPPDFEASPHQMDQSLHDGRQQNETQSTDEGALTTAEDAEDGSEEYVWVKKKKQTVCVVTGRETEWTAVQDPASRAIYYKNTRTGQSQWEEPDAVRQLANAAGARTSQEASRVWEALDSSRSALAAALAREKRRQLAAHEQTLLQARLHVRQQREDIAKREEQARLAQLLPRSSFVRRKKQSMMMKVTSHNCQAAKNSGKRRSSMGTMHLGLGEAVNEIEEESVRPHGGDGEEEDGEEGGSEARLEEICANEPALDIFLSTYLRLRGVRDLQVLTTEKRLCNCLFHYYVALVDPVHLRGMSKGQFRVVLRDAQVIPGGAAASPASSYSLLASSGSTGGAPPLKLHVTDLIFAQAERTMAQEGNQTSTSRLPHRQAAMPTVGDTHLSLSGFTAAMQIVRERVVAYAEQQLQQEGGGDAVEIDDDEEWFMLRYLVPLALRLGARLLTQIRRCKEVDLQLATPEDPTAAAARRLVAANRAAVQLLHRHYSRRELDAETDSVTPTASTPKAGASRRLAVLTFRGLALFAVDFGLLAPGAGLPALHFLLEAINWISGSAHTEVVSFEKFQQLLVMLAVLPLSVPGANAGASWLGEGESSGPPGSKPSSPQLVDPLVAFFKRLASSPALLRVTAEGNNLGSSDDLVETAPPASSPWRPQLLFVLEPPSDAGSSGSSPE